MLVIIGIICCEENRAFFGNPIPFRSSMRIVLLAIIGLFSYLIIAIPGYFFLVPRNDVIDESIETMTEQMFEEPGKEPKTE